jgi:hypothetical protein
MTCAHIRCSHRFVWLLVPSLLAQCLVQRADAQSILNRSPNLGQDWTASE